MMRFFNLFTYEVYENCRYVLRELSIFLIVRKYIETKRVFLSTIAFIIYSIIVYFILIISIIAEMLLDILCLFFRKFYTIKIMVFYTQ